jgi:uncharacterized protein (TIGR03067 family)
MMPSFALIAGLLAAMPNEAAIQKEQAKFDGTWVVTNDESFRKGETWIIEGGRIREGKEDKVYRFFSLQPWKKVAEIDVTVMPQPDGAILFQQKGIYRLEGDELRVYFAAPEKARPAAFPKKPDGNLLILKRQKP